MTKFQFILELLGTINLLLETEITSCTVHQARICLDSIFETFEELGDTPVSEPNTRGDLEHYSHIISNIYDKGFELWKEEKHQAEKMQTDLSNIKPKESLDKILDDIAIKDKNMPKHLRQYFHTIENIEEDDYTIFLDESEGNFSDETNALI